MIVSINQPAYLPWLGYFHRIAVSDLHIVLDHVQFEKNSFSNRNKVRTAAGSSMLTVPLRTKGKFGELALNQVEIVKEDNWARKHWSSISQSYAQAPYFAEHKAVFAGFFQQSWTKLFEVVRAMTEYQLEAFGIKTPFLFSSELKVPGSKDELVLNLCQKVGANTYLSGPLGRNYLRPELFESACIKVLYHDYCHPTYTQTYPGFEPYMAAIDVLFNCGPQSLDIIKSCNDEFERSLRPAKEGIAS